MKRRGRHGDLRSLADVYLGRLDPEGRRFASRAATGWRKAVGEEIARHTTGSSLKDGQLLVFVDSPVWANELSLMSEQLRGRINEEIGEDLVRSVRFSVSKRVRQERAAQDEEERVEAFYAPDEAAPAELSEQERLQVEYLAAAIDDEGLRDAAVRAMTKHLEWKKGTGGRNGRETRSQ